MHLKVTYINDESLASTFFLYRHETLEAEKSQGAALFLFVLGTVSRSYEAKKYYFRAYIDMPLSLN